jgi:hypothetical protein
MDNSFKLIFSICAVSFGLVPTVVRAQSDKVEKQVLAAPGNFRISTGFGYSRGDYGDVTSTEVFSAPISLTYTQGPWKVRVSVPWVSIDGPGSLLSTPQGTGGGSGGSGNGGSIEVEDDHGSVIDDDDEDEDEDEDDDDSALAGNRIAAAPTAAALPLRNQRSGIGDASVAVTYSFDLGRDFYLEPTARLKLPTGSRRKRLGTGKVDLTLAGDLVKEVGDATFYVHGRRKLTGKPANSSIRSTWGAGAGASLMVRDGLAIGADYDWQQSAFRGDQSASEVTGWVNARLAPGFSVTAYAGTGLNRNSADFLAGFGLSIRL